MRRHEFMVTAGKGMCLTVSPSPDCNGVKVLAKTVRLCCVGMTESLTAYSRSLRVERKRISATDFERRSFQVSFLTFVFGDDAIPTFGVIPATFPAFCNRQTWTAGP